MNSFDRLSILLGDLEKLSWEFLFNETRTLDTTQLLDNSHQLYFVSASDHASGVAILVASKHVQTVRAILRISVIAFYVCLHARLSRIVAVYFPHSSYSLAEINEIY